MAQEIQITINAALTNPTTTPAAGGQLKDTFVPGTQRITQALAAKFERVFDVATAEGALALAGITTLGWCLLQNLDATNYVDFGPESAGAMVPLGRLKPGESAAVRLKPGITLRMQANTAACRVQVKVWND